MDEPNIKLAIAEAVRAGNVEAARQLFAEHLDFIHQYHEGRSWLQVAAHHGSLPVVELLIQLGCDVNAAQQSGNRLVPLDSAIGRDAPAVVRTLLEHGANANQGRQVISAVTGDKKHSLEMLQLLEQHGADIHQVFLNQFTGQPMNALSTAIAWAKADVIEYLKSKGAVLPEKAPAPQTLDDEVVGYFTAHFGPVLPRSLIEIVPTEPPIAVRVIPATAAANCLTLFTTGMSSRPMPLPGGKEERYAEAFIQLPADWKYQDISDPDFSWPILELRSVAKTPHRDGAWSGGPIAFIAGVGTARPFAPSVRFTSLLLVAEGTFRTTAGRNITAFRLVPLFPEEYALAVRAGPAALLDAFGAQGVSLVVNTNRRNVALPG